MVQIDFYKMRPSGNMQNVRTVTKWGIINNFLALRLNKKTIVNVKASEAPKRHGQGVEFRSNLNQNQPVPCATYAPHFFP